MSQQRERFRSITEDITALEERLDSLERENKRLRERVAELDARTDMLELVESTDDLDGEGRSTALLQHMQRKIAARPDDTCRLTVDRDTAEEALHYPDVDRTTIYDDMRRCARLVGDEDRCWYAKKGTSPRPGESVLVLHLPDGELSINGSGPQ